MLSTSDILCVSGILTPSYGTKTNLFGSRGLQHIFWSRWLAGQSTALVIVFNDPVLFLGEMVRELFVVLSSLTGNPFPERFTSLAPRSYCILRVLQDIIPFLVEPALFATGLGATPSHDPETQGMRDEDHEADQAPERSAAFVGQEERCIPSKSACSGPRGWDGESSFTSGLACRVDALRVGEALCSVGRTLAESLDLSAMVKEGTVQDPTNRNTLGEIPRRRNRGDAGGVPNPLVTVALQLLFVLSPTDLCSGGCHEEKGTFSYGRGQRGRIADYE